MTLQTVFSDLVRYQIELWNEVDAHLRAETGLPLGSFESLSVLHARGPCRVQDIADDLVVTVGGVSKIVDRIEARGLCRRRSNPDDRRSSLVELTPEGDEAHRAASTVVDRVLAQRLSGALDSADLAHLAETLRTLRAAPAGAAPVRPAADVAASARTAAPTPAAAPAPSPITKPISARKAAR